MWESTLIDGTIPPYEGSNVLSWQTNGKGWFGAGIMSVQPLNLFDFGAGYLKFRIKIPANVTFKIGIIDTWGNQYYVEFPAYQTKYGLVRDGQWGQASIPVERHPRHRDGPAHAELPVRHPRGARRRRASSRWTTSTGMPVTSRAPTSRPARPAPRC